MFVNLLAPHRDDLSLDASTGLAEKPAGRMAVEFD
jgi:hypothetical protein